MARAKDMTMRDGIPAIAEGIIALTSEDDYEHRNFPYTSIDIYSPDKPSLLLTWDGIAEDLAAEGDDILIPSAMRYTARILNLYTYPADGVEDAYAQAQLNIQIASAEFFQALNKNRHLDNLVLDIEIASSNTGDMVDPTTEEVFYGHEMVLTVKIWN